MSRGHLVIRGRTAPGAGARLSLNIKPTAHRAIRRTFVARGGRFSFRLRGQLMRTFRGTVDARFAGNRAFRPSRTALRVAE